MQRLILNEVREYNSSNEFLTTSFNYDNQILPSRHSTSVDNWGYFNGQNNGFQNNYNVNTYARQVNLSTSAAQILKKITHPTGGTTEFIYEHNRAKTPAYFSQLQIPYNNPRESRLLGMRDTIPNYNNLLYTQAYHSRTHNYTIPENTRASFAIDSETLLFYDLKVMRNNNHITDITSSTQTYTLSQGNSYKLVAVPKNTSVNNMVNPIIYSMFYFVQSPSDSYELYVGGKRIKQIIKKDREVVLLQKEFSYTDEQGHSTGRITAPPADYGVATQVGNLTAYMYANSSRSPLTSPFGSGIGYAKVTEHFTGTEMGKTEYYFETHDVLENFQTDFYKFPYNYPNDYDWSRGNLIKQIDYYKTKYNTYKPIKETQNIYGYYGLPATNPTILPSQNIGDNQYLGYQYRKTPLITFARFGTLNYTPGPNVYEVSYLFGGETNLRKTIIKEYPYKPETITSDEPLVTETTFKYLPFFELNGLPANQIFHNQVIESTTINSKNEILKSAHQYAFDSSVINEPEVMALRNKKINSLLIAENYNGSDLLSASKTIYKDWSEPNSSSLLLPEKWQAKKGNENYETRNTITKVDEHGNVLEYFTDNGVKTCLIWGYNDSQVVAKIINMEYSNIPTSLIANIKTQSDDYNTPQLEILLDSLYTINATSQSQITTYSYNPLIGVKRVTDVDNKSMHFIYDAWNRLKHVKDDENNFLSTNEYYYRTN